MWNLNAVILCCMGWLEWKLIVVLVVVGFFIYVYFEVCLVACYFQIKEIYRIVGFVCGELSLILL
jgi:hypothetical protein